MSENDQPPHHVVQLVSLWATDIACRRRTKRDGDPASARVSFRDARLRDLAPDGSRFTCELKTGLTTPVSDEETWEAQITLVGAFSSTRPLSRRLAAYFTKSSGLYVMWPFARSHLEQLGLLAGVVTSPLPLIIRPAADAPSASRRS